MGALHGDAGLARVGGNQRPNNGLIVNQFALKDGGNFVAFGHHIVRHQAFFIGQ